jgi:2,3-dihydroxyphenylpropionate 1,2-dioxygenase
MMRSLRCAAPIQTGLPGWRRCPSRIWTGPIEDEAWLGIKRTQIPGTPDLSGRLITNIMNEIDVAYAEEW